ncbi:MAG: hypothetical protein Q8O76_03310, partial [Chloroflexota bacterium]|nr:hypothetical protein [Chloroflexota bacterium]
LTPLSTLAGVGVWVLAQLALRDFNRSVNLGVAAIIFLPVLFGGGLSLTLYALALFLALGAKKILDLPHERRIWAASPWRDGATPGWYREKGAVPEEEESVASVARLERQEEVG